MVTGTPRMVTDGLVLYLDAGNTKSYPSSGTTWTDLSSTQLTGSLTNGPTFSSANVGSLVFDGTNDFIDFTSDVNLLPTAGLTLSVWFKTSVSNRWLITKSSNASDGYLLAGVDAGTIIFIVTGKSIATPSVITTGNWLNIVGTWTPSTSLVIYQNGNQVGSNTVSIPASITDPNYILEIGRRPNGGDYWNGSIGNVQIYNRALSASEVLQNFEVHRERFGV